VKTLLFILLSFIAVTAFVSGLLIISSPDGGGILNLQLSLLKNTPFKNFLVPGIILTVFVGITNLLAVFFNIQRHANRYNWAMAGGLMLCGWIIVQMILLNVTSWLQFIYLGTGLQVMLIAYQLKGKWAV
jgi:hypothetical protein